jgi:hypothetical protein
LATGLSIVWDRFFRDAPTAIMVMRPLSPQTTVNGPFLRVTNPSDRPILLSWVNGHAAGRFGVMKSPDIEDIIVSVVEGRSTIVLDAGGSRELPIRRPTDRH